MKCVVDTYSNGNPYCAELAEYRCPRIWTDTTGKQGLLTFEIPTAHLAPFNAVTNWYYNYQQEPQTGGTYDEITWSSTNNIEFIPMIGWQFVNTASDRSARCYLHHLPNTNSDWNGSPMCSYNDVKTVLQRTVNAYASTTKPVQYLMGYNEPWNTVNNIPVGEVLQVHREFIEPVSDELGLELISFTVSIGASKTDYLADFIHQCYLLRNDALLPCTLSKIKKWSLHNYNCKYDNWFDNYGKLPSDTYSTFDTNLLAALDALDNTIDWEDSSLELFNKAHFVTEHTCNEELDDTSLAGQADWFTPTETCEHMTGQSDVGHGPGSMWAIHEIPAIEKFCWWAIGPHSNPDHVAQTSKFFDDTGVILPPGKAWLDPVNANCYTDSPTDSPIPTLSPTDSPTTTPTLPPVPAVTSSPTFTPVKLSSQSYFNCKFVVVEEIGTPYNGYFVNSVGGNYRREPFLLHAYTGNLFPTALGDELIHSTDSNGQFPWVNVEQNNYDGFTTIYDSTISSALEFSWRTTDGPYLAFSRRPNVFGAEHIAVQNAYDTDDFLGLLDSNAKLSLVNAIDGTLMDHNAIRRCSPNYSATSSPTLPTKQPTNFPTEQPTTTPPTNEGGGIGIAGIGDTPTAAPVEEGHSIDWAMVLGLGLGIPLLLVCGYLVIQYSTMAKTAARYSNVQYKTQVKRGENVRLVFGSKV